MVRGTLNLGIVAHVDAGKTTLTERLLYAAGVIDEVGSVDDGTTQTDSLALERQRGITIKSAVVSFTVGDVTVNLIDTPGHPDFIAEVERALSVLDGAVLVISAVEGVQPQTRILMRALQRLRVPAVLFVNKIDRRGADSERVLGDIAERLTPAVVAMGAARELGTRAASVTGRDGADDAFTARLTELLAEQDEAIMAAYVRGEPRVPYRRLRRELAVQARRGQVYPVFFGLRFRIEVELGSMPLAFFRAVEDTARETLRQGLHGWAVPDCTVAITHSGYLGKHSLGHQRFNKSMSSTGEDYRKLTPLVLTDALRQAGTVVCEPIHRFRLDAPADTLGPLLAALTRLRAVPLGQTARGLALTLEGDIPAARVHELRAELPALTRGEGVLECSFDRYEPVTGVMPTRPRTDDNPLNREEYLQRVTRRASLTAG